MSSSPKAEDTDVKPSLPALESAKKPTTDPDEAALDIKPVAQPGAITPALQPGGIPAATQPSDIKPVIPGLEKPGVDFVEIRPRQYLGWRPDEIWIYLAGSKGGVCYKIGLVVYPGNTVQQLKDYLADVYGYEAAPLRLVYDGQVLANTQSMGALEVENNDIFDVFIEQLGG
ncbi:Small ubiquitin-related modifier 2 [Vanrija albida]|uniref:Small ubiquitin-related modifier 2 n=1 Tax=Vanrija albida TaxID=181172 RepID=A0ABR3Q4M2_9TREE